MKEMFAIHSGYWIIDCTIVLYCQKHCVKQSRVLVID